MKITMEYEEADEARDALDGYKWKLAMWDLDQLLRSTTKYGTSIIDNNTEASSGELDTADKIREKIQDILNDYGLKLD
jgi:hypothetical protein